MKSKANIVLVLACFLVACQLLNDNWLYSNDDEKLIDNLFQQVLKDEPKEDLITKPIKKETPPAQKSPSNLEDIVQPPPKKSIEDYKALSKKLIQKADLPKHELERLKDYSQEYFYSDKGLDKFFHFHTVQTGDTLSRIARKYHITSERIAEFNPEFDPNRIFPGQKIKIVEGPNLVLISKSHFSMYLIIQNVFFEKFEIGIGREGKTTPLLKTTLSSSRAMYPTYTHPETKEIYPYGHPDNPIGTRWMGFEGNKGYGIHGTNDESSIGKAMSSGCIRMKQTDLEHVFNLLYVGDKVEIKP